MNLNTNQTKLNTRKTAVCGVLSAAAVVIMFFTSLIGVGIYVGPYMAAFSIVIIQAEYGNKAAFASYFVTALIGLLLIPDRELAIFYVFFGWYPILVPTLNKISSKIIRIILELIVYALIVFLMYGVVMNILGLNTDLGFESMYILGAIVIVGAFSFLLTGPVFTKASLVWKKKFSKKIRF